LRFALDGQQITAKTLRAFERKQLEQKLRDDRHAAQVASKTLGQIEHQIDVKKIGLDFLDNRTERFAKSALVEAARGMCPDFFALSVGLSGARHWLKR
jgi:hypothetical protein